MQEEGNEPPTKVAKVEQVICPPGMPPMMTAGMIHQKYIQLT
jgi:hypothetical protein